MLSKKNILIISPDQLQCLGLKTILEEYFEPESVSISRQYDGSTKNRAMDYIFLPSDIYLAHLANLQANKRIVILTDYESDSKQGTPDMLNVTMAEADLVDKLKNIFQKNSGIREQEEQPDISAREIDVLKLVAQGYINKQIADKLSISLHTVISHRKNITRKLGIKTVSGLTVYALLNGLVTSKDIGS